jgi:asparagine synthase (glutamine-hydrolysing)
MCGITGNFGYIEHEDFSVHLQKVSHLLSRRGPDQINILDIEHFFAAHSRLIVQGGLDDGVQPMRYQNIVLLFNGNLYNKDALREDLKLIGYKFNGVSDTEVVAVSIHHWGNKAFNKFNGFFSIAYFNADKKSLTLARDRLGQKPLYYSKNDRSVFFGSTENLVPKKFCGSPRRESFIDFITFGFVPSPNTMYENLFSINPGSFVEFSLQHGKVGRIRSVKYWEPKITNEINDFDHAVELISAAIDNSITDGMDASIDVACLLSGGVDSSLIFSNARNINQNICAITADFGEHDDAESRASALIKTLAHGNHSIKKISKEEVDDSLRITSKICDSPFDDTSIIPSNIVFQTVKDSGYSVALTGDGADELFCGYSSFGNLKKLEPFLDSKLDCLIRNPGKIFRNFIPNYKGTDLARFFMFEDELLTDLLCNGFKKREWGQAFVTDYDPLHHIKDILDDLQGLRPMDKFRILNLKFKLPYQMMFKVDRASMFNSVEARPLFLNNQIIDAALSISSSVMLQNGQKSILKEIYQSQIPNSGWNLPKTGFGWKTESYKNIFNQKDNEYLKTKLGIDGFSLLSNRKRHHKRGYYGLFALVSWMKEYDIKG